MVQFGVQRLISFCLVDGNKQEPKQEAQSLSGAPVKKEDKILSFPAAGEYL